ncbi:MAG: hypothetical protein RIT14_2271 [Pseudomonadota bacterium]
MAGMRDGGDLLAGWQPAALPGRAALEGRHVRLERLEAAAHAEGLHRAFAGHDRLWDFMPYGPFATAANYGDWVTKVAAGQDPAFWAIRDLVTAEPAGVASWLRITPDHGTIEVGHICLSPALQKGRAATEAMVLMMGWAFDAGYRRYEWKCDARNLPSRRAAQRLGFSFEGIFRQHMVIKGRNRDTAWFAITDADWPALRAAFAEWLDPANFDAAGRQRRRLSDLTAPVRVASDPGL